MSQLGLSLPPVGDVVEDRYKGLTRDAFLCLRLGLDELISEQLSAPHLLPGRPERRRRLG